MISCGWATREQAAMLSDWVCARIAYVDEIRNCQALAVLEDGRLIAAVLYTNFHGGNVDMHVAADSPRWLSRAVLREIFGYPFGQLGCRRVTAVTARTNHHTRRFLKKVGFRQEGIHREGYAPGLDAVSFGMLSKECRWLDHG